MHLDDERVRVRFAPGKNTLVADLSVEGKQGFLQQHQLLQIHVLPFCPVHCIQAGQSDCCEAGHQHDMCDACQLQADRSRVALVTVQYKPFCGLHAVHRDETEAVHDITASMHFVLPLSASTLLPLFSQKFTFELNF